MTTAAATSQRRYEACLGLQSEGQYALGERWEKETVRKRIWAQGAAVFRLLDYKGKHGKAGATYIAWRLPNIYRGIHELAGHSRLRSIGLVIKQAQGNDWPTERLYGKDGRYWPDRQQGGVWYAR